MLTPGGGYTVHEVCIARHTAMGRRVMCEVSDKFGDYTDVNPYGLVLIALISAFLCWYLYYDRMQRSME